MPSAPTYRSAVPAGLTAPLLLPVAGRLRHKYARKCRQSGGVAALAFKGVSAPSEHGGGGAEIKGRRGKTKKVAQGITFFGGCGKVSAIFFNRVFELLLLRNAQKRDKTKIEQNNRGREKKTEEKKPKFSVMSPAAFFGFLFLVFLNSPCYETPKNAIGGAWKEKKSDVSKYYFWRLRKNSRDFF
jgi:hypothetical protein